jgi:hypothetical protein
MLKPTIPVLLVATSLLAGCAAKKNQNDGEIRIGDASGYVGIVKLKQRDVADTCNLRAFEEGFKYTYMSMWNSRIEKILEVRPSQIVADYYSRFFFNSKLDFRATLDEVPEARSRYNYCQELSYQEGKLNGFIYSLEGLKMLEENAPM